MAFTSVPDKAAGDIFTEAMWDTYIMDNFNSGVLRKLADTTLGVAAASIDMTSIPQTFAHLKLELYLRTDVAAAADNVRVRFNGDTAANYDAHSGHFTGAGSGSTESIGQTAIVLYEHATGSTATANEFGKFEVIIPHYTGTTSRKGTHSFGGRKTTDASLGGGVIFTHGGWRSTAAITQVTILPGSGANLAAGSRVTLYGVPA
jgi:hypothetical protein